MGGVVRRQLIFWIGSNKHVSGRSKRSLLTYEQYLCVWMKISRLQTGQIIGLCSLGCIYAAIECNIPADGLQISPLTQHLQWKFCSNEFAGTGPHWTHAVELALERGLRFSCCQTLPFLDIPFPSWTSPFPHLITALFCPSPLLPCFAFSNVSHVLAGFE